MMAAELLSVRSSILADKAGDDAVAELHDLPANWTPQTASA